MGMVRKILHWYDAKTPLIDKVYVTLLGVVLFAIVLHAPLSVGLGALFPDADLAIKSWKEILLGFAGVLLVVILTTKKQWGVFHSKLFYLILAFAALNLALIPVFFTGIEATLAGVLINLRYLFAFALVFAAVRLYPKTVPFFLSALALGGGIVLVFALLQLTVLPYDILRYIGYGAATIAPYGTVDENMDFIRIISTLRGANPLGAYMVILLSLLLAFWLAGTRGVKKSWRWLFIVALLGAAITLWATYSRSAVLGAAIAAGLVLFIAYGAKVSKMTWLAIGTVALLLGGSLLVARDTPFVSTVILHEDPSEGGEMNSNDQHAESLAFGVHRMLVQPIGGGIGSTGSASLHTETPTIIENQYLFIAHETGWLGLALFIGIMAIVLGGLWRKRQSWLALGVFASGVALAFIGVIQPVWVDDTVSIVWWSLAAIALAAPYTKKGRRNV